MQSLNSRFIIITVLLALFIPLVFWLVDNGNLVDMINGVSQPPEKTQQVFQGPQAAKEAEIVSLKLLSVDYFTARVEIVVKQPGPFSTSIGAGIPAVSSGFTPHLVFPGKRTLIIDVFRNQLKNTAATTHSVEITNWFDSKTFFKKNINMEINWPGPEYRSVLVNSPMKTSSDFSSVSVVSINHFLPDYKNVIKGLLEAGLPIEKIETFGSEGSGTLLNLGEDINIDVSRKITAVVLSTSPEINSIRIKTNNVYVDSYAVTIGGQSDVPEPLPTATLEKLRGELSGADYYTVLDFKPQSNEDKKQAMFEHIRQIAGSGAREYSIETRPGGGFKVMNFREGLLRFNSDDEPVIYQEGVEFPYAGNGTCVMDGEEGPCIWHGFEFDYESPDEITELNCINERNIAGDIVNPSATVAKHVNNSQWRFVLEGKKGHYIRPQYISFDSGNKNKRVFQDVSLCYYKGNEVLKVGVTWIMP